MTDGFRARVDSNNDEACITLEGELDLATAHELWAAVEQAVVAKSRLVIDLSEVTFIDSSGLGVLIRVHQLLGGAGALVVRSPKPQARRLLQAAGVETLLTVDP
jgi:anti-anti-sigma factor